MKIAVAGATGRVGRHVVDVVKARAHDAVAISRATGVDVITGDGLADALAGVESVIDVATGPSPDQDSATEFFTTAARNLHEAASDSMRLHILEPSEPAVLPSGMSFPVEESPGGLVWQTQQPLIISNGAMETRWPRYRASASCRRCS